MPTGALTAARGVARRLLEQARRPAVVGRATAGATDPTAPARHAVTEEAVTADGATLLTALQHGVPLAEAVVRQVRDLWHRQDVAGAQSLADALANDPATEELGSLARGIVAALRGFEKLAWSELEPLPSRLWARYAVDEYVRSGYARSPQTALEAVRTLLAEDPAEVPAESWLALVGVTFGAEQSELARDLFARFGERLDEDPRPRPGLRRQREWLAPWVGADPTSPKLPRGERPSIAVIDYGHPGMKRASANIGDHVQSIASLGHLVRHQGVRFRGQGDLVDLLEQLQSRTRPELQRADVEAEVDVLTIHRDASSYQEIPEGTWVLCFGWYMHALFRMRYGFPLHEGLRPIFISFHCNKRDLMTQDAIDWLRKYAPIGCRDWTTVYLLLSVGVPAFFSGCLTTTVSTVFAELPERPGPSAPVAYVDVPQEDVPAGAPTFKHSSQVVRTRSFTANCYEALDLLETYRTGYRAVVTSRLHCYLPVRSLGMEVDFQPANRSDVRFDGLIDITDGAFEAIRTGIIDKLERVYTAILSNASEDDVYALWREITADDVRAAERRRAEEMRLPAVPESVSVEIDEAVSRTSTTGPAAANAVDVVVELGKGEGRALEACVAALDEHATRALHVWVLSAHDPAKLRDRVAKRFPEVTFSWVPVRRIGRGWSTPTGQPPGDATLLTLGRLLPEVDRAVVLPISAVATADIAELAELDLAGHLFAAPTEVSTARISGFGVVYRAAERLESRTRLSASLRRVAHARHAFDFDAFTTDVMVLDLRRMREERLVESAVPLVAEFGTTARETLHVLVGEDRAVIPANWCNVPTWCPPTGPGITYWADEVKPWEKRFTASRALWSRYADER